MVVYLDNAATTKTSKKAVEAMLPYFTEVYGNASSLHTVGQIAKEELEKARQTVADCLGANANEIYFTSGGSESDNQAIISAITIGARKGKKHIVSSKFEHHAELQKQGVEVTLVDVNENGVINPSDVENAIREDTALVTIMMANNEIGTIQPIKEIGAICKKKGVLFHTDAVQSVGHLKIDVVDMNIDMLSLSAHKFHGPKGVAALYARKGIYLSNVIEGGAQEKGKRGGTENLPAIVGMAVALKDACENIDENAKKIRHRRGRGRRKLLCKHRRSSPSRPHLDRKHLHSAIKSRRGRSNASSPLNFCKYYNFCIIQLLTSAN